MKTKEENIDLEGRGKEVYSGERLDQTGQTKELPPNGNFPVAA